MAEAAGNSSSIGAAVIGFIALIGGALIRWWPKRQQERNAETVGLAGIYSSGLLNLLDRQTSEIRELRQRVADLERENEELRQELAEIRGRLDATHTAKRKPESDV